MVTTMADMEGNEAFDAAALGTCAECSQIDVLAAPIAAVAAFAFLHGLDVGDVP